MNDVEFTKMVLTDAGFIIEFLLRRRFSSLREYKDPIFNTWDLNVVNLDLWLLENQLPFFIIQELFNKALESFVHEEVKVDIFRLVKRFAEFIPTKFPVEFDDLNFSTIEHFVDVIIVCLRPPNSESRKPLLALKAPSATELYHAGVKFEVQKSSKNLFEIKFNRGVLQIPQLRITKQTEPLLRNAMAFEQRQYIHRYISNYASMMKLLVSSPKDVELLIQNEIIDNWLSDSEALSFFDNLVKGNPLNLNNFYFADLVDDLNAYCRVPWHQWKTTLKEDYFKTPWAIISVIAAIILLGLSLIQAVCSILQVL